MPSLQPHCEWPQTSGSSIKSELPDGRVGKPLCLEGLLRTSEGLPPVSGPLLASLGRDRLPCSLVYLCLLGCPEYGCLRLFSFQSPGFLCPLHCICYALPTASPRLWEVGVGPTGLYNSALKQPEQPGQEVLPCSEPGLFQLFYVASRKPLKVT